MDKFISMRVFTEVVQRGSFARAAERLNLSPAFVTRHVASLEKQLGTPLLIRTTRSLTLTERGEIYLERVRRILAEIDETEALVSSASNAYQGLLRISVLVNFGLHFLPAILRGFQQRYPNIEFDVALTDDPVDFAASGHDVSITFLKNAKSPDTVVRRLGAAKRVLCATPEYLDESPPLRIPEDLTHHRCIAMKMARSPHDNWQLQGADGQVCSVAIRPFLICDTGAMLYQCVLSHLGIGSLSTTIVQDSLEKGKIVKVLTEYQSPDEELVVAYPGRSYLTSKARAFVDYVLAYTEARGSN